MASQPGVDIAQVQAYAQGVEERHKRRQPDRWFDRIQAKRARSAGYPGEFRSERFQQSSRYPSQPARSVPPQFPGGRVESTRYLGPSQSSRASGACFSCGRQGHIARECPFKNTPGGIAQPTGSVAGSSSSVSMRPIGRGMQIPAGRGRGHGGISSSGGPSNHIYALASRQDQEASPKVVTASCRANVDCRNKVVRFQFPGESIVEWTGNTASPKGIAESSVMEKVKRCQYQDPVITKYRDEILR
ncbi:uncharacterized protein LOC129872406 [Solanum dulcamara]|uniref:uncharacterized protein LOC129872406 n=1 Tax=Solanum dulcamara TaxID=45834 RepID=UPI002486970A|nr:uncharacterized protein LOC129872406 [Solanum dulcamara]